MQVRWAGRFSAFWFRPSDFRPFPLAALPRNRYFPRMEPREALVALNLIEHVGPVRVRQLLGHCGDAPAILRASKAQLPPSFSLHCPQTLAG